MVRPTVAIDNPLVVFRVLLTGQDNPIATNQFPDIAVTVRPPYAIVMVHPLEEFEVHLKTRG